MLRAAYAGQAPVPDTGAGACPLPRRLRALQELAHRHNSLAGP
ncbi:hypothetical protein GZL_03322 [Streptomyces sp. 769]|nr:hypothetical protein GZL_03322 [Streptomyces sp. 769]